MIEQDLSQFIDACTSVQEPVQLWQIALKFMNGRGVKMVSYHHLRTRAGGQIEIASDGFPEGWACEYIREKLYRVDPIPELSAQTLTPFRWSQAADLAPLARKQQQYLEKLQSWNLGDGLALQVFGPGLRNGYVGLGFGDTPVPVDAALIAQLQMAAQVAHQRYCQMTDQADQPRYDLSPREREVLTWVARGKSNSAISGILSISPHTVDTHLRRIYEKLSVTDRTSAAIVGLGSSLIQPSAQHLS